MEALEAADAVPLPAGGALRLRGNGRGEQSYLLSGTVRIPKAAIELKDLPKGTVAVSDDVIIVGESLVPAIVPYLRKFNKYTVTDFLGDRFYSDFARFVGVVCALFYFFFSIPHRGAFGGVAKTGIYILMIGFGATFGFTVMGRISLLIGRIQFLLGNWLGLID